MATYARLPVVFEKGDGAWLWDEAGRRYLDAVSGVAVCGLGHAHPAVRDAICAQAGKLLHTSNLYQIKLQESLAGALIEASGLEKAFFCNSGAEANEAAIKIARKLGHERGIDDPCVLVMEGSFHGRTMATLSATGNAKVREGFEPLVSGFIRLPYDDLDAVSAVHDPRVVAMLVEPVQGEGGVRIPRAGYLKALRQLCDQRGWLLMLDEVQTGIGRTGSLFAFQQEDILPDVMTLAKALGNGVPIGACLARGKAAEVLSAGKHGSTFGGNPLACSAALAVLKTIASGNLAARAKELGDRIAADFRRTLGGNAHVLDVRNKGLMIGIELDQPCGELVALALDAGLLVNVTAERTIRLLPPLIMTDEQAQLLVQELAALIASFTQRAGAPETAATS